MEFCGKKRNRTVNTAELLSTDQVKAFTKKVIKGFQGVENIYTQHTPELKELLEELSKGKLRETQFPFLGPVLQRDRPNEIIVFVIGGVTYEESLTVYNLNKQLPGTRILLGGSNIHNTASFLEEVKLACEYSSSVSASTSNSYTINS